MKLTDMPSEWPVPGLEVAAERRSAAFNGGNIVWRRFGGGDPLVLLHGGHGAWLHWARNIQALATQYTVWVPDLPGYGESDIPLDARFESLVHALDQSLGSIIPRDQPIALAGFSFGGLTAAALASRRGHVNRLSLFGSAGHGVRRRPRGELLPWREALTVGDMPRFEIFMRHNLLMHMLYNERSADTLAIQIHAYACKRSRFHSRTIAQSANLLEALAGYEGPLLVAWGEHDVTTDPAAALHKMVECYSGCEAHLIRDAGHWVQYEASEAVNQLLISWMCAKRV